METLLIDILSPPFTVFNNENFEVFFTLLGLVKKAEEIATNLANRLFSYSFITIGNISSNYINSANTACDIINTNLFAYIAPNRYLSDKFYKIMIDTSASKYSITGYKQFMTYRKDIKYMTIDIFKAVAIRI